jgi:uncharacterized protein (TIGR02444 family)
LVSVAKFCRILTVDIRPDPVAGLPGFPFWDFSLQVYGRAGVSAAAIALQDEAGLDVNLLLFCLWIATAGPRRLSVPALGACAAGAERLQSEVIGPLRRLRRRARLSPAGPQRGEALHQRLLAAELAGEHLEQQLLAAAVADLPPATQQASVLASGAANLRCYLEYKACPASEVVLCHLATLLSAGCDCSRSEAARALEP